MYSMFEFSSHQITAIGSGIFLVIAALSAYVFREQRAKRSSVVVCPPVAMPGRVEADGYLRVTSCSRLPDGETCDQKCVAQLAYSPDTLDVFLQQHHGEKCASCSAEICAADWYKSRMHADAAAITTSQARTQHELSHRVCWSCFVSLNRNQEA